MHKKIVDALRQAIIEEMDRDPNIVLLGEDIAVFNGSYRVTEGLYEKYGELRVRDTPISEAAIVGAAIGAAMTGLRPIAEIQFNDFMTCAMDQICNQAAKVRLMMGGQIKVPLVIRAPYGATGRAAQHSQSLEAWFMHTPGLKIIMPATPYDAKGLLKSAIRDDNPVLCFEHKLLYGATSPGGKAKTVVEDLDENVFTPAPEEEYLVPLGEAKVVKPGKDVTIVATGYMLHKACDAADELAKEGLSIEVIDPRTLVPFDLETLLASVEKTGRLIIATEDVLTCGVSSEISALVCEKAFSYLKAPIARVAAFPSPVPFASACEADVIPDQADIEYAVKRVMS